MPKLLNVLSVRRPFWTLFGVFALVSQPALAVPTQLTQGQFQAVIAGDPTVLIETFTSYSGAQSNPFLILNGT